MQQSEAAVDPAISTIERAMVRIRRSQTRRAVARTAGTAAGVDPGALAVVDALAEAEDRRLGPVSIGALATLVGAEQSRASRMATAAVRAGLARRRAAQDDGRRSLLTLTDAGRRAVTVARETRARVFAAALTDFSEAERAAFADLLDRFVSALADITVDDG